MDTITETAENKKRTIYPEIIGFVVSAVSVALLFGNYKNFNKQALCVFIGIMMYKALLETLKRDKLFKIASVAALFAGAVLLAANVAMGISRNGAQNWMSIGNGSFQPSELVKITIAIQAMRLKKAKSNMPYIIFMVFSAVSVLTMAVISDFGTAFVYFISYMVVTIQYGKYRFAGLAAVGAAGAGFAAVKVKPYIAGRFLSCGKAWENAATTGYQQTRTLVALASGGLFGVGLGKGWLRSIIYADTDMVFGIVCEELGLITGAALVVLIILLGIVTLKHRDSYGAVSAVTMLITQMALNVLGSVDIIPFTGVTFPFLSRGGTSVIACWCLIGVLRSDINE